MGGETEQAVSAWTIDSLHSHYERVLGELDRRYEQRFEAQERALASAFASAEKAVNAALASAEKAVQKAEDASEKRFESVNEFRQTLTDQTNTFMPRTEITAMLTGLENKVDANTSKMERFEGHAGGINAGWVLLGQAVSLLGAVIAIVLVLAK